MSNKLNELINDDNNNDKIIIMDDDKTVNKFPLQKPEVMRLT